MESVHSGGTRQTTEPAQEKPSIHEKIALRQQREAKTEGLLNKVGYAGLALGTTGVVCMLSGKTVTGSALYGLGMTLQLAGFIGARKYREHVNSHG